MKKGLAITAAVLAGLTARAQPGPVQGTPAPRPQAPAAPESPAVTAEWLRAHPEDPGWPQALKSFVAGTPELDKLRSALDSLATLPPQLPFDLAFEVGGLLEIAGSPVSALRFYRHASERAGQGDKVRALLAQAALEWELGEDERALVALDSAVAGLDQGPLRAEVSAARALIRNDVAPSEATRRELREAVETLPAASQARLYALLALVEHARAAGQSADQAKYIALLDKDFPGSPEAVLASQGLAVARALSPRRLLRGLPMEQASPQAPPAPTAATPPTATRPPAPAAPPPPPPSAQAAPAQAAPQPAAPVRIQAGSFTVPENATFMTRDLAKAGFPATTEKVLLSGKAYFRVFLTGSLTPEEARVTLVRLKEAGFEGVIVP